jgi:hypothetical protein
MKNQTRHKPTAGKFSLLRQLCNFIPPHLVPQLARQTGVKEQPRTFSPWSHVVSLLYAQLTHALRLHSSPLSALRGATPTPGRIFGQRHLQIARTLKTKPILPACRSCSQRRWRILTVKL